MLMYIIILTLVAKHGDFLVVHIHINRVVIISLSVTIADNFQTMLRKKL